MNVNRVEFIYSEMMIVKQAHCQLLGGPARTCS